MIRPHFDTALSMDLDENAIAPLIALVGPANSGKTTLFNLLTGSHYATVNYPGATVEYALAERNLGTMIRVRIMDTPGLTSLIPKSPDEEVTVQALFKQKFRAKLVLAVADGTQLSRHLYLLHQLRTAGFPLAVVVTMDDLLTKQNSKLNVERLAEMLDTPVLALNSRDPSAAHTVEKFVTEQLQIKAPPAPILSDFKNKIDEPYILNAFKWSEEIEAKCIEPILLETTPTGAKHEIKSGFTQNPDKILLHPLWGLLIFFLSMAIIFTSIFWAAQPLMEGTDWLFGKMIELSKATLPTGWVTDLFADGVLAGIGAVVVFLPQIVILFMAMGYLEDTGYLARGAALMDRPLSKIGLNGRAFLPLLSGYACAIPAMMAARTIRNRRERVLTILVIPLMSCSARLPVYTLLLAFLIPPDKPWIGGLALTALYAIGLILAAAISTLLTRFMGRSEGSSFILELPSLKKPLLSIILKTTYYRGRQYLEKAGPTILIISILLWVLTHTPTPGTRGVQTPAEEPREYIAVSQSFAGKLGQILEPAMEPMGLDWKAGVAMISGFAAREVFVGSLALMYRIEDETESGVATRLLATMKTAKHDRTGEKIFTPSSVFGILVFFIIALQCFPTVAVARRETGKAKIALFQLFVYTGCAYLLSVASVQALRFFGIS